MDLDDTPNIGLTRGLGGWPASLSLSPRACAALGHSTLLAETLSGGGIRAWAGSAAERVLLARLEVTGVQRGAHALAAYGAGASGASPVFWWPHDVLGRSTGYAEGVGIGQPTRPALDWARAAMLASGADMFRFTCAAPGPEPDGQGPVRVHASGGWTGTRITTQINESLPLAPTYEATLAQFGRHTRRNLRHGRKLVAERGFGFQFTEGPSPFPAALRAVLARRTKPRGLRERRMARLEAYAHLSGRPFRSVLRTADGQPVSYCCGMLGEPGVAYLVYQLNDSAWSAVGPSLLHRGFLLEALIAAGCRELVFVHGCSGTLRHSCQPMPVETYWLMRRTPAAYLGTAAVALLKRNTAVGRLARSALGLP